MAPQLRTTRMLEALTRGERDGAAELIPLVYDELRSLASAYLSRERHDHTLQPTALVHEVYLRMVQSSGVDWRGRAHFLALAAVQIRRILVDHARKKMASKRGGDVYRVTLVEAVAPQGESEVEILALHEALERLATRSARQAQVVELRYFAGLSVEETAEVMSLSKTTVKDEWAVARAWLQREMAGKT